MFLLGKTTPKPDVRGGVGVDDRLMREPRLLVPGQKPVGLVRVDPTHRLASKLKAALVAGVPYEIVSGKPVTYGGTVYTFADSRGRYVSSSTSGQTQAYVSVVPRSFSFGTGAFSVMSRGRTVGAEGSGFIAEHYSDSYYSVAIAGGVWTCNVGGGNSGSLGAANVGQWASIGFYRTGAGGNIVGFRDGIYTNYGAAGWYAINTGSISLLRIGGTNNYIGTQAEYHYLFDGVLPDREFMSFHLDPFQMFVPA